LPQWSEWGTTAKVGVKRIIVIVCLLSTPVWASEPIGSTAEFLGWEPGSRNFAYALTTRSRYGPPTTITFMKRTGNFRRAKRMGLNGSVRRHVRRHNYRTKALSGQRLSKTLQSFALSPSQTLRVALNVGKTGLTYTVWLDTVSRPGESKRLIGGVFDELWTSLDAEVYPSPNGRWAAIVLTMRTSFRVLSWVEGVSVGAP